VLVQCVIQHSRERQLRAGIDDAPLKAARLLLPLRSRKLPESSRPHSGRSSKPQRPPPTHHSVSIYRRLLNPLIAARWPQRHASHLRPRTKREQIIAFIPRLWYKATPKMEVTSRRERHRRRAPNRRRNPEIPKRSQTSRNKARFAKRPGFPKRSQICRKAPIPETKPDCRNPDSRNKPRCAEKPRISETKPDSIAGCKFRLNHCSVTLFTMRRMIRVPR
jgi:hypothetical protein